MSEVSPRHEIAHLARVELFSPRPQETVDFFTKLLGMYVTRQEGQSVYLRGYEDPYPWSLKVTESTKAGMGHAALRASSADALERRVKSLKSSNVDGAWSEDEFGYGKTFAFQSPMGAIWRCCGGPRSTSRQRNCAARSLRVRPRSLCRYSGQTHRPPQPDGL